MSKVCAISVLGLGESIFASERTLLGGEKVPDFWLGEALLCCVCRKEAC